MATAAKQTPTPKKRRQQSDVIITYDKLKFDKHDVIGRGAFATVYKARHVDWGCYVAYKKLGVNVDRGSAHGEQPRLAIFMNLLFIYSSP